MSESNDFFTTDDEMEFTLSDVQFDLKPLPKWKEQILKADKNENGIEDKFEVKLNSLSELGYREENFNDDKENLEVDDIHDDIFKSDKLETEKNANDDIPIIISFPNGNYDLISLLFEKLGGKLT